MCVDYDTMDLFRKAIVGNEAILVRDLEVDSGLWTELLTRGILTEPQLQICKTQVS